MKQLSCAVVCLILLAGFTIGADAPQTQPATIIEISKPKPPTDGLSTVADVGTARERPFREKVNEQRVDHWAGKEMPPPAEGEKEDPIKLAENKKLQVAAVATAKAYTLNSEAGKYVGWFAIVRKSTWNETAQRSELILQHCYYDGLSDGHIQVVSIYGAGDFRALVAGKANDIPLLGLVRVYGRVSVGKGDLPEVTAEYVRVWDWGLFTFMDYGIDRTNEVWRAMRHVDGENVYTPRPTRAYYESVLGTRAPLKQNGASTRNGAAPATTLP